MIKPQRIIDLEEWAAAEKRVTAFTIMKKFEVTREVAETYYDYLRDTGVVGSMGYVMQGGQNG